MPTFHALDDLLRDMQQRQRTPGKVNQSEIARRLGRSQSTLNKWVSGVRSITNANGRELFIILRGYGYDALEIKAMVEAIEELPYPPQLAEGRATEAAPGMVDVLYEGSISEREEPSTVRVWDATEGEFDQGDLRIRIVKPGDLVTAAGKVKLSVRTRIWLHTTLPPEPSYGAIIEQKGVQAFCIWPFDEAEYVMPIDPKSGASPVLFEPDRVRPVARVVFISEPHF